MSEEEKPRSQLDELRMELWSTQDPAVITQKESILYDKLNKYNLHHPDNCKHCFPKIEYHPEKHDLRLLIEGIKLCKQRWIYLMNPPKKKKQWGE